MKKSGEVIEKARKSAYGPKKMQIYITSDLKLVPKFLFTSPKVAIIW